MTRSNLGSKGSATAGYVAAIFIWAALALLPSSAAAQGASSIAAAPLVAYGQQQFGNTAEGQYLEDSCGFLNGAWRSYWQLPVLAGDRITVNWEGTPGTRLALSPVGTTDFTFFTTDAAYYQELSSNRKAQAQYTAPVSGAMPMTFRVCEYYEEEPGPYDFVASAQHALVASLTPAAYAYRNSVITGSAHLADGSPASDGLVFNLVAKWHRGREVLRAAASTTTVGGGLSFQLALPVETTGKVVRLAITRGEDGAYQATRSAPVNVKVARKSPRRHRHHKHKKRHHR